VSSFWSAACVRRQGGTQQPLEYALPGKLELISMPARSLAITGIARVLDWENLIVAHSGHRPQRVARIAPPHVAALSATARQATSADENAVEPRVDQIELRCPGPEPVNFASGSLPGLEPVPSSHAAHGFRGTASHVTRTRLGCEVGTSAASAVAPAARRMAANRLM
jgi:hypothetical protein